MCHPRNITRLIESGILASHREFEGHGNSFNKFKFFNPILSFVRRTGVVIGTAS